MTTKVPDGMRGAMQWLRLVQAWIWNGYFKFGVSRAGALKEKKQSDQTPQILCIDICGESGLVVIHSYVADVWF